MSRSVCSCFVIVLWLAAACSGDGAAAPDGHVASVEIIAPRLLLPQGSSMQLTAIVRNAAGHTLANKTITWLSSEPLVAPVTSDGFVSAAAPTGITIIRADCEGVTDTITVQLFWRYATSLFAVSVTPDFAMPGPYGDLTVHVRIPTTATTPLPVIFVTMSTEELSTLLAEEGYAVVNFTTPIPPVDTLCAEFSIPHSECSTMLVPDLIATAHAASVLVHELDSVATVANVALDSTHVAAAGWSEGGAIAMMLGGATVAPSPSVQNLSLRDDKFIAVLGNSSPGTLTPVGAQSGFLVNSWQAITVPAMQQSGAGDTPSARTEPFAAMTSPDKYLAYFDSPTADHSAMGLAGPYAEEIGLDAAAFLDAYVRNNAQAQNWLTTNQLQLWTNGVANISSK